MLEHLAHMYDENGALKNWIPLIGERVGAYMVVKNKTLFFGYGRFLGNSVPPIDYDFSEGGTFEAGDIEITIEPSTDEKTYDNTNPKIKLDNGGEVWGYECWWRPADEFPGGILSERPVINTLVGDYRRKLMAEDSQN
jgi:hypothetical protein